MIIKRIFLMGIPLKKIKEINENNENSENLQKDLINLTPEILSIYPEEDYFKNSEISRLGGR